MAGAKILFLEDDILYRESVSEFLTQSGLLVDCSFNGEEFLDKIFENSYDLYLIDINVPKIDGLELLKLLRQYRNKTITMILTSMPNSALNSFKCGCDDHISKSCDCYEILLRIRALIRRQYNPPKDEIALTAKDTFNIFSKRLRGAHEKSLGEHSLLLLDYLLKNSNRFVSTEELEAKIYRSENSYKGGAVRYHVWHIRKTLGDDIIISCRTRGYKINHPAQG